MSEGQGKFGLGIAVLFVAIILGLASFVLLWFGVLPGVIMLFVCVPLAIVGLNWTRRGKPASAR